MNINDLFDSILKKLRSSYDVKVYKGKIRQNMNLPCFFVNLDSAKFETSLQGRYILNCTFKITYLHNMDDFLLFDVAESLCENLLFLDDLAIKSRNINFNIKDNTLIFLLDFKIFLKDLVEKNSSYPTIKKLQERIIF